LNLSISIHAHSAWKSTDASWQVHASEMMRRARHLLQYWKALKTEFFHNCEIFDGEYLSARDSREAFLFDKPVHASTHRQLHSVVKQLKAMDTNKWFSRPAHEIWPDLPGTYYAMITHPLDFGTIDARISAAYYANYKQFLDEVYLVLDNAVLYNKGAPHGSDGARVAEAAEELIWKVVEPWSDATIDMEATFEVADLAAIIAKRESTSAAQREIEEERIAALLQDAAEKQTAGSLVAQLDALWSVDFAAAGDVTSTVPIEALLLSARGPPVIPHVAWRGATSVDPQRRLTALEELHRGVQLELSALGHDTVEMHPLLASRLRAIAAREGRAGIVRAMSGAPASADTGSDVPHFSVPEVARMAGRKRALGE
jgi:hypothetical protein